MRFGKAWKSRNWVFVGAVLATWLPAVGSAMTISLTPATSTITQGDSLTLSVDVTGVTDVDLANPTTDQLFFQFGISYDPLIFTALAPVEPLTPFVDTLSGLQFGPGCGFFNACSAEGTITGIFGFGLLTNPPATTPFTLNGTLAVLTFTATGPTGLFPTTISLTTSAPGDGLLALFDDQEGNAIQFPLDFTSSDASVTVIGSTAAVPEPTTLLLLGSGLAAAIRTRRRFVGRGRPSGRPTGPA